MFARIDFVLFEKKEGNTGDYKERHYFTGQKWYSVDDPLFILGLKTAFNLVGDNGFIQLKFKKGDNDGETQENG